MSRLIPLAALALVLVVAGCASATAGGPGAPDGAASLLPGSTTIFVAARTNVTADEWHGIGGSLLKGLDKHVTALLPALGDEVDVAVLNDEQVVALTQPTDESRLAELATAHGLVTRKVGGWTAYSKAHAALDELGPSALSLADNNRFRAAMDRLPDDALVRAYSTGDEASRLLSAFPGQTETSVSPLGTGFRFGKPCTERTDGPVLACLDYRWAAAALTDVNGGLKLEGYLKTGELIAPEQPRYVVLPTPPYTPGMIEEIPADVLAVVDFPMPSSSFTLLAQLPPQVKKLFGSGQYELPDRLDAVLHGESAIYVRAGLPLPEITLVTQPIDTAAASEALGELVRNVPAASFLHGVELYRAVIGGQFVVSTSPHGIADFRGGGPKLSADPSFRKAAQLSGLGDEITGLLYVNAKDAVPLLRLAGVELPAALPDLRSVIAFGAQGQNERTFTAFVQVGSS